MEERVFESFPKNPPYTTFSFEMDRVTLIPGLPLKNFGAVCGTITDSDVLEIRSNPHTRKHLYIYGRVVYNDHLGGKPHHTYFCSYSFPTSGQIASCPTYNDAD
jgi:hypothetical protein